MAKPDRRAGEGVLIALITAYLLVVGLWLVLNRRIPAPGFARVLRAQLRPAYSGVLASIEHEQGKCFVASLPEHLLSDKESISKLELLESDCPLGPAHAAHAVIRADGGGSYSHWGDQLYFSTSDGTDPRTSGRVYRVREVRR
jgi:hypothetical protein